VLLQSTEAGDTGDCYTIKTLQSMLVDSVACDLCIVARMTERMSSRIHYNSVLADVSALWPNSCETKLNSLGKTRKRAKAVQVEAPNFLHTTRGHGVLALYIVVTFEPQIKLLVKLASLRSQKPWLKHHAWHAKAHRTLAKPRTQAICPIFSSSVRQAS
jgi:hypothetical protein